MNALNNKILLNLIATSAPTYCGNWVFLGSAVRETQCDWEQFDKSSSNSNTKSVERWKFYRVQRAILNLIKFHLNFYHLILAFLEDDEPATKSFVQLSALEAESIVDFFIATMYGGGHDTMMNGNMEASMIPGSTGMSPSPTVLQQHADMYHNNGNILSANAITSLRTHSSKFPVSIFYFIWCDWKF